MSDAIYRAVAEAVQADSNGRFRCPLPGHGKGRGDINPSAKLSTYANDRGQLRVRVECFSAACDDEELWQQVVAPYLPPRRAPVPWRITAVYRHPDGHTVQALRHDHHGGGGCPVRIRGQKAGEWVDCPDITTHKHCLPGANGQPAANLRTSGLLVEVWDIWSDPVIICEGEKAADTLHRAGWSACTSYGGSKRAAQADWSPLKGRRVLLWPDADRDGDRYIGDAYHAATAAGAEVAGVIRPPQAPPHSGYDAADLLDEHGGDAVAEAIGAAQPYTPPPPPPRDARTRAISPFQAGQWYAQTHMADRWLYDESYDRWHQYTEHIWKTPVKPEAIIRRQIATRRDALAAEVNAALGGGERWFNSARAKSQTFNPDLLDGIRHACAGQLPRPPAHLLNTPSGVIDLRDQSHQVMPHDPSAGHRAITGGNFRPDDRTLLRDVLHDRLSPVLSPQAIMVFIELAGLSLAGRAQSHRSLVMLTGVSGSGKGGCIQLLCHAVGDYAITVDSSWLDQRRGDIDVQAATIIFRDPKIIAIDELGSDTKIAKSRINQLTGDNTWVARLPFHSAAMEGKVQGAIWTTSVSQPQMDTGDGINRRLAVIPTLSIPLTAAQRQQDGLSQDIADALITAIVFQAHRCFSPSYQPTEGIPEAKAAAISDMDEIQDWLDALDDGWDSYPLAAFLSRAQEDLGDWVSNEKLALKIRQSPRWMRAAKRERRHGYNNPQTIIQLRRPGIF